MPLIPRFFRSNAGLIGYDIGLVFYPTIEASLRAQYADEFDRRFKIRNFPRYFPVEGKADGSEVPVVLGYNILTWQDLLSDIGRSKLGGPGSYNPRQFYSRFIGAVQFNQLAVRTKDKTLAEGFAQFVQEVLKASQTVGV